MDMINEDINSDNSQDKNDSELSSDLNISPISKSRYGRTRKPKISEDFYDIDVIFETAKDLKKSPRLQPPVKQVKVVKNVLPKKMKDGMKQNLKVQKFEHVTADLIVSDKMSENRDLNNDLNSKAIHNFFKSESGMSVLQNTTANVGDMQKNEIKSSLLSSESLNLEPVDVTQVLKIISTKSNDDLVSAEVKVSAKPVLKTYTNKRKSYNKMSVVESFGLPDTPIFPIESDKLIQSEPKRIKNLDVAAPSSEDDINLVDKKLLHTPWKIASMDAEIPDIDLLIESACDDYREDVTDDLMESPIKVLNEVPSIFVEPSCDFEPDSVLPKIDSYVNQKTKTSSSPSRKSKRLTKLSGLEEQSDKISETVHNKKDLKITETSTSEELVISKKDDKCTINEPCLEGNVQLNINNTEATLPDSSQSNEDEKVEIDKRNDVTTKEVNENVLTTTVEKTTPIKKSQKTLKSQSPDKQHSQDKITEQANLDEHVPCSNHKYNNQQEKSIKKSPNDQIKKTPLKKSQRKSVTTSRLSKLNQKKTNSPAVSIRKINNLKAEISKVEESKPKLPSPSKTKKTLQTLASSESSHLSPVVNKDESLSLDKQQPLVAVKKSPRQLASTLRLESMKRENLNNRIQLLRSRKLSPQKNNTPKEENLKMNVEKSENSQKSSDNNLSPKKAKTKETKPSLKSTSTTIAEEKPPNTENIVEKSPITADTTISSPKKPRRKSQRITSQENQNNSLSIAQLPELEKSIQSPKKPLTTSNSKGRTKKLNKSIVVGNLGDSTTDDKSSTDHNSSQEQYDASLSSCASSTEHTRSSESNSSVSNQQLNTSPLAKGKKGNKLKLPKKLVLPNKVTVSKKKKIVKKSIKLKTAPKKLQPVVVLESGNLNLLSINIVKKSKVLSLKKQKKGEQPLKPEDVTPLATSPVKSLSPKRKTPRSSTKTAVTPIKSELITEPQPKQLRSSVAENSNVRQLKKKLVNKAAKQLKNVKKQDPVQKINAIKLTEDKTKKDPEEQNDLLTASYGSKEIKQECIDDMDENSSLENVMAKGVLQRKNGDIKIGDLMWAQIRGHPYWPCLIVKEPNSQQYRKVHRHSGLKGSFQTLYHVRFFGDKGRRSWVNAIHLMTFQSRFDLKQQFQHSKNKANFIVKPSALTNWKIAVDEAESLLNCNIQTRFDFFTNMFINTQEKKYQPSIKEEPPEDSPTMVPEPTKKLKGAVETSSKSKKLVAEPNIVVKTNDVKSEDCPVVIKQEPEASATTTEVLNEPLIKNPCEGSEKNLDVNSEYSFSDTDTASKSSSNTPILNGYQDQIMRQKRNNLFRGVGKERVCQVCTQPSEVYKCRFCKGLYHFKCASFEIKPETDTEDKTLSDPDSTQNTSLTPNEQQVGEDLQAKDDSKTIVTDSTTAPEPTFNQLSIAEQIDIKMKEVMQNIENHTRYADSTTDYSSSEESSCNLLGAKVEQAQDEDIIIKHVTADHISFIRKDTSEDLITETSEMTKVIKRNLKKTNVDKETENGTQINKIFQCGFCLAKTEPPCYACGKNVSSKNESLRQRCSLYNCGKFYHPKCVKLWPQTQWSIISTEKLKNSDELLDTFVCPIHSCHTCSSDDPRAAISRCSSSKLAKCLRCPATYHTNNYCVPAGTQIFSTSQIICPRHFKASVKRQKLRQTRTVNTPWCFICSKGGDLICCETCPTSVHTDCLTINFMDDETFICEDCESGRFPLYDEIVWVKLGKYRWWPAVILFPNEVPDNIRVLPHNGGEFVVKFFGSHDHYWVGRGRVFLFQEGDKGHCSASKNRVDTLFKKSIEEATAAHTIKKIFRKSKEAEIKNVAKPPPYIRVKVNKAVGNVRLFDGNVSNTTSCECSPVQENPCGPDSDCINRLLLTECDPNICPAKEKCNNQRFEKRQYPPLLPYKTQGRGWGLKTLAPINKGDFVIEYVGEIIDDQEYQRRLRKMHEKKDENYYFLTIDNNRIIDAGPKGNLARFMNHCCQPNCVTQKWTVNGDTRVGLFAIENIAADSEVTFNYNLECVGKEKKICKCGTSKCSGFIGVKVKDESQKKTKKTNSIKKKKPFVSQSLRNDGPCFVCGKNDDVAVACHNKICTKQYHLACINLENWPEGKWVCPWHNCNICTKRTIRCCVKCTNSYCPVHSEGNVRYDKLLGFVCSEHDSMKEEATPEPDNQIMKNVKNSNLTTDETDVTSTTCDDIETMEIVNEKEDYILSNTAELVTSTPIKKPMVESTKELHINQIADTLEVPQSSIPENNLESKSTSVNNKKRKQNGQFQKVQSRKKLKLKESITKRTALNYTAPNLLDIPLQNEVKLCSSVPIRHLRTTRSQGTSIINKRFLRQQNELEKDLPIRKRSRPRCEITL